MKHANVIRLNLHISCKSPTWMGYMIDNNTVLFTNRTEASFNNFALGYLPQPSGYVYSDGWYYGSSWKRYNRISNFAFTCQYRISKTETLRKISL